MIQQFFTTDFTALGSLLLVAAMGAIVYMFLGRSKNDDPSKYPRDVVILHQFPRGLRAPSVSAFALKLETWLRMAGIPYQNEFAMLGRSSKGKVPWITYNGIYVADSQFCIEFLMERLDKNLSQHLSPYEKSLARAFLKLNEESMRWTGVIHRFRHGKPKDCGIPWIPFKVVGRKMLREADAQGYGKHTKDELYHIAHTDLEAVETFLNGKKFLMGDKVCNEDASFFGLLCQAVYHDRGPINKYITEKCPNIQKYVERIKTEYWPDWDEVIREKKSA